MLSMVDEQHLAFELGAADYLTKPVERDLLIRVLRERVAAKAAGGLDSLATAVRELVT
jgi:CheY-like chemotaxis protein